MTHQFLSLYWIWGNGFILTGSKEAHLSGGSATGTILTGTVNVLGDPAFTDPANGDYHLGPGSAAVDAGVDSGLATDIDGDPRPVGGGYDIGADEVTAGLQAAKRALTGQVYPGERLTFTLAVTNTGIVPLNARITDTLPAVISPTGTLTWTTVIPAPGGVWSATIFATAAPEYTGPVTNVIRVTTLEGPAGAATATVQVLDVPLQGLLAFNDGPTPLGQPTTLSATVTAGINIHYEWQFGDGLTGTGPVVTHNYSLAGTYTATITASNPMGVLTATTQVTVTAPAEMVEIYLPVVQKGAASSGLELFKTTRAAVIPLLFRSRNVVKPEQFQIE